MPNKETSHQLTQSEQTLAPADAMDGPPHGVVITGVSGRFPASASMDEFKENLLNSVDMVTTDDSRWPAGLWNLPERNGKIPNIDQFDVEFFGIPEEEVPYIDPQERLMLETTYEAIVDSGVNPAALRGSCTGFYFGTCFQETHTAFDDPMVAPSQIRTLATRVSRHFQFRGPIVQTDTACGSSFTALNEAFLAIKAGLCDQAVVAGSNTLFRPRVSLQFHDLTMITKDGKCKCLDDSANGYVRSEACVVFFLQRSSDAKRVYCTILNSKSNSDGYKVEGITFPSRAGQRQLVSEVYQQVGVDPTTINYIEAHVTGTSAGDPVEMDAMYDVICEKKKDPLYVGCLKSNMGHSEGASGLCALAKAVIVFQTGLIPPNLHYSKPNVRMRGLMNGKMVAVTKTMKFKGTLIPVNCFGFGGANVHVLTELCANRPVSTVKVTEPMPRLIQLCGRTVEAVDHIANKLQENQTQYMTNDFLSLVNDFATIRHSHGMNVRGYIVVTDGPNNTYVFDKHEPSPVTSRQLNLVYKGAAECKSNFTALMEMPVFAATIQKANNALMAHGLNLLNGAKETPAVITVRSVALQLAMADTLRALNIVPDGVFAFAEGYLAAAYSDGALSLEEAIVSAFEMVGARDRVDMRARLTKVIGDSPRNVSNKFGGVGATGAQLTVESLVEKLTKPENGHSIIPSEALNVEIGGSQSLAERHVPNTSSCPLVNFVRTLGAMYMNGSNGLISKLYPAVQYPMPSQTPSLSSLIKWKSRTLALHPFLIQSTSWHFATSRNIAYHFDRRAPEDTFLYDHRIDGRVLFPATGYLMMAWRAFAILHNISLFKYPVEFSDISFERATVMSATETNLTLRINEDNGQFIIKEGDNAVVHGRIRFYKKPYAEPVAVRLMPPPADAIELDSRDIYKEFRIRGYDYGQFFQGLNKTRSDGRTGQLIWRDVLSKAMQESMSIETAEDQEAALWLRSWTTFTDAMFQLLLMSNQDTTRNLFVPRRLESIICFPDLLRKNINDSSKITDAITLNDASFIDAYADPDENLVWVNGLIIKGLKTSLLKRRQQFVRLKRYYFAPHSEKITIDTPDTIRMVEEYYEDVLALSRRVNTGVVQPDFKTKFDLNEDRHSFLRILCDKVRSGADLPLAGYDLSKDLLVGRAVDDWFYQERLLKPWLEMVLYEMAHDEISKVDVFEYNRSSYVIAKTLLSLADESLLCDSTVITYSLMHPSPSDIDTSMVSGVKEIMEMTTNNVDTAIPMSNMIVYRSDTRDDTKTLFQKFYKQTRDAGFLMAISKERIDSVEIDNALENLELIQIGDVQVDDLKATAKAVGYQYVGTKTLYAELLPMNAVLFKKQPIPLNPTKQMVVELAVENYSEWFPEVRRCLDQLKEDEETRLWLTPKINDSVRGVTGVLGFVKSIRLESGYHRVRCLIDATATSKPDLTDPKYADLLRKDLVYNMYGGDNLGWGTYEHVSLPRAPKDDHALRTSSAVDHVYLKSMKPGDLSSFAWVQNAMESVPSNKTAQVYYAPLNFRDIMFATGRLAPEAIPGIPADVAQDSILGLEFSGRDCNGNRVMGVVPYKALATTVELNDMDLIWPVPSHWSMEDAATVPCVYATAYYSLIVRGNLSKGESVLIHSGAGGVGLAAISVALAEGCLVYVTVGSQAKRDHLLKSFPALSSDRIFNSRELTFEDDLLKKTGGAGVDVILNSLAEDKLQAGLRCLAPNGRFLEIGKVDFIQDNKLFSWQVDQNRSFHGVLLDSLFRYSKDDQVPQRLLDEKRQLKCLVMNGIRDGTVKPLPRTIFDREQVEEAFRYMSSGKHIGKVVLKIREETTNRSPSSLSALKVSYMSPNKSYVVIGGLGGFGLEVVMWLADKGAKKIVIGARRGIREPYQQFSVNRLHKRGVKLVINHNSAATVEGARLLIESANAMGPCGGVFNTAVQYDDQMFDNMSEEQFARVMAPKLNASINLDRITRQLCPQLDYFVTFSSISCGRGNTGQTNYNFANSTMDSLCEKRVAEGLPGTSIQWGVVGDVGIITEKSGSTEVNLLGATSQRLHSLLDSMDRFLQSGFPVVLSYVKAEKAGNASGDSVDLLKMVSRIFGIKDISTLDAQATLGLLGIDSLIAVEMKQLLERVTGNALSVKEIRDLKVSSLIELSKQHNKQNSTTT